MPRRFQVGDACYEGIDKAATAHLATVESRVGIHDFGNGPQTAIISPVEVQADGIDVEASGAVPVVYVAQANGLEDWIVVNYYGNTCELDGVTSQHITAMAEMFVAFLVVGIVIVCLRGIKNLFNTAPHAD